MKLMRNVSRISNGCNSEGDFSVSISLSFSVFLANFNGKKSHRRFQQFVALNGVRSRFSSIFGSLGTFSFSPSSPPKQIEWFWATDVLAFVYIFCHLRWGFYTNFNSMANLKLFCLRLKILHVLLFHWKHLLEHHQQALAGVKWFFILCKHSHLFQCTWN